jgi:tRNA (mo5U34)-methyltransferase
MRLKSDYDHSNFKSDFTQQDQMNDLRREINQLPWFHQIDFGDGILSPGVSRIELLRSQADVYFRQGIEGKSFLDIGCWDGFNSFEAKRRGANRVLATDHYAWSEQCWGDRRSFDLARAHLAPDVEVMDIDLADLTPSRVGQFDVVLFAGVLYHLRHPLQGLEIVAKLVKSTLIVETHLDALDQNRPMMVFYPGTELGGDGSNWWGPNQACVEAMLRDVGFPQIDFTSHPNGPGRGIFHCFKSST